MSYEIVLLWKARHCSLYLSSYKFAYHLLHIDHLAALFSYEIWVLTILIQFFQCFFYFEYSLYIMDNNS